MLILWNALYSKCLTEYHATSRHLRRRLMKSWMFLRYLYDTTSIIPPFSLLLVIRTLLTTGTARTNWCYSWAWTSSHLLNFYSRTGGQVCTYYTINVYPIYSTQILYLCNKVCYHGNHEPCFCWLKKGCHGVCCGTHRPHPFILLFPTVC